MKCAYKREIRKKKQEQFQEQENMAATYANAIALKVAEEIFGLNDARLKRFHADMYQKIVEAFDAYKEMDAEEFDSETVPFIERAFKNRLEACGVEYKNANQEFEMGTKHHNSEISPYSSVKRMFKNRLNILRQREQVVRQYWYAYLLTLAEDRDIDGITVTAYYRMIRREYQSVWEEYLNCSINSDHDVAVKIAKTIKYIKDKGIAIDVNKDEEEEVNGTGSQTDE